MKKKTLEKFALYNMPTSKENVRLLKQIHAAAVKAAIETKLEVDDNFSISYGACISCFNPSEIKSTPNLFTQHTWHTKPEAIWIIPRRKYGESYRGYMSRLNAWAWEYVLRNCFLTKTECYVDKNDELHENEIFDGFAEGIQFVGFDQLDFKTYAMVYRDMNILT